MSLRNNVFLFVLAALSLVAAFLLDRSYSKEGQGLISEKFHKQVESQHATLQNLVKETSAKAEPGKQAYTWHVWDDFSQRHNNKDLAVFIYYKSRLAYWSTNQFPVGSILNPAYTNSRFVHLDNGWFQTFSEKKGEYTVVGFGLLKSDYPYQNQYLENNTTFKIPQNVSLNFSTDPRKDGKQIKDSNGKYLYTIRFEGIKKDDSNFWSLIFYVSFVVFLICFFRGICLQLAQKTNTGFSLLVLFVLLLVVRINTVWLRLPEFVYNSPMFDPSLYAASSWLPSFGDYLLNAILLSFFCWVLYKELNGLKLSTSYSQGFKKALYGILLLGIYTYSRLVASYMESLIVDSNISFNINDLFTLDWFSFLGFIGISLLLASFFFLADLFSRIFTGYITVRSKVTMLLLVSVVHVAICHFTHLVDLSIVMWSFPVIIVTGLFRRAEKDQYQFSAIVLLMLSFSYFTGHILYKYNKLNEHVDRELLGDKLMIDRDPEAEYLFGSIQKKTEADQKLGGLIDSLGIHSPLTTDYILEKYFSGFWEKYNVQITPCAPADSLLIQETGRIDGCHDFFGTMIIENGQPTFSEQLFYLPEKSGETSYIGRLELGSNKTFYVELYEKLFRGIWGYPELLLDKEYNKGLNRENYSYARYQDGNLVTRPRPGEYQYEMSSKVFDDELVAGNKFVVIEDFEHYIHQTDKGGLIVISKPSSGVFAVITPFSYAFSFFSIVLLFILFLRRYSFRKSNSISFKDRVQVSVISTLFVSLICIGIGTIFYISRQYQKKNDLTISEKTRSVLIEVDHKLGGVHSLSEITKGYMDTILFKFSAVFFTDINLYDTSGYLLATSRPKVFEEGLMSNKMNVEAIHEMKAHRRTEFIHQENIGTLNYLSAYVPFTNRDNKVIAFLNLPYFAKQSELKDEISNFMVALINIYVLLFALTILVALFVSNRLTQPLKLIQNKIASVRLGKANEIIEWKGKDEIGSLVEEYNRMVRELAESADMLAKSERESAWREMAKQVAHEIKNPLTPMKLSVQHLERSWGDKAPDWEERLKKTSATLIEQIDALSAIATEFSNFAKMPKAKREKVDLCSVVESAAELFMETKNIQLIKNIEESPAFVDADRDQLLRVFTNLIKNGIQAIPETKKGIVKLKLRLEENSVVVELTDNGTGISEEQKENIFVPNFTTKTSGMGLGLAMVKSIIESSMGSVWFESAEGEGTTFFVKFPLAANS